MQNACRSKVETAAHQTLWPNRPHDTKGHRMLFPNRQNFIVFSQNTEIQSALRTQAPMEPLQVFMNPNSSTSILEINISSKTWHKGLHTQDTSYGPIQGAWTWSLSLLRHTNSLSTPSGGLGVLATDTKAPVVTQTTVVPG